VVRTCTINDIVGDFEAFQQEYFNQKPMFRRNALPRVQQEVLSLSDMDTLINLEIIRFPYIKVNLNGSGVPEAGYTRDMVVQGMTITGVVDPEKVYALYRAGATVTWASVNQILPKVREFVRVVSQTMAVRTDAVAFLTPQGKKGYPAHHDGVDLFIIQLSGSKHWRLWDLAEDRRSESASYTEETLGAPVVEEVLRPGDVLYLPYGTPHQATAVDEPSLHLSVMMRPRMWRDLLRETVDSVLSDEEFLRYPALFSDLQPDLHDDFQDALGALTGRLSAVDVKTEWERLRATGRSLPGSSESATFQESVAASHVGCSTLLTKSATDSTFRVREDGKVLIEIGGLKFAVSQALAGKISQLRPGDTATIAELMHGASEERQRAAARALVRMGLFSIAAWPGTGQ
jgi:ribosomal protein L16 Arg81 hydroxylase